MHRTRIVTQGFRSYATVLRGHGSSSKMTLSFLPVRDTFQHKCIPDALSGGLSWCVCLLESTLVSEG